MKRAKPIERARALVLEQLGERPWFCGLGIGRLSGRLGLVLSVRRGSRRTALRNLPELPIEVEIEVREIGPVRAR